tara:strand:+ start:223 stop:702 length:480 start_codon:yes stop_codon:yes gene_type:complete
VNVKAVKGFTLTELMIVVGIIAAVGVFAAPMFSSLIPNRMADRLYQEIEIDLRYARSQAVTTSAVIVFQPLNSWRDGWRVVNSTTNQELRARGHDLTAGTITSANITTAAPLTFDINGRSNTDATIVVNVPGCTGDKVRTLSVNRIGQIQVTGEAACAP